MARQLVVRSSSTRSLSFSPPGSSPSLQPHLPPSNLAMDLGLSSEPLSRPSPPLIKGVKGKAREEDSLSHLSSLTGTTEPAIVTPPKPAKPAGARRLPRARKAAITMVSHSYRLSCRRLAGEDVVRYKCELKLTNHRCLPPSVPQQTPSAIERLRDLAESPSSSLLRIGVRTKGCAGMAYHLEYVDAPGKLDDVVEQDGVKVVIDSKALMTIIGSEMDWVEDRLSYVAELFRPSWTSGSVKASSSPAPPLFDCTVPSSLSTTRT